MDIPETAAAAHKRVLVVDDDEDTTALLSEFLRILGHEVHCASDGLEAVTRSTHYRPDVILLDLNMPRLNGFDAARRIRQLQLEHQPLIVATTGLGRANDRVACEEAGIDVHLLKPVELQTIQQLLDTKVKVD